MVTTRLHGAFAGTVVFLIIAGAGVRSRGDSPSSDQMTFGNDAGVGRTISTAGSIDLTNPFFQPLGTNGRSCVTCHQPAQAWTGSNSGVSVSAAPARAQR